MKAKSFDELQINNYNSVKASKWCGCVNCHEKFHASEVTDFLPKDGEDQSIAVCPKCYIDSVVADADFPEDKFKVFESVVEIGDELDLITVASTTIDVDDSGGYTDKLSILRDKGFGLPNEPVGGMLLFREIKKSYLSHNGKNVEAMIAAIDKLYLDTFPAKLKQYDHGKLFDNRTGKEMFGFYTKHSSIEEAKSVAEKAYNIDPSTWIDLHPKLPEPVFASEDEDDDGWTPDDDLSTN